VTPASWQVAPTAFSKSHVYKIVYFNLLYGVVMFVVPLTSLAVLSRRMVVALRAARRMRTEMMGQLSRRGCATYRHEDDITVMLVGIVVMFITTQTPALVTQV